MNPALCHTDIHIKCYFLLFSERNQLRSSLDKAQSDLENIRGTTEDPKLERQDEAAQRDSLDRRLAGLRAEVGAIASNLSPALGSDIEVCFFIGLAVCTNLSVLAHKRFFSHWGN